MPRGLSAGKSSSQLEFLECFLSRRMIFPYSKIRIRDILVLRISFF